MRIVPKGYAVIARTRPDDNQLHEVGPARVVDPHLDVRAMIGEKWAT